MSLEFIIKENHKLNKKIQKLKADHQKLDDDYQKLNDDYQYLIETFVNYLKYKEFEGLKIYNYYNETKNQPVSINIKGIYNVTIKFILILIIALHFFYFMIM